jgi:hypothetical protein
MTLPIFLISIIGESTLRSEREPEHVDHSSLPMMAKEADLLLEKETD